MALSGSDLYDKIKPVIDKKYTSTASFLSDLASAISGYVVSNDSLEGSYEGVIPPTTPVINVAVAKMTPVTAVLPEPSGPGWVSWLQEGLSTGGVTWQITPFDPLHTFPPVPMNPIYAVTKAYFTTLGDLQDIHSAYGIWALLSDLIVICVLSAIERITPVSATGTDGSTGIITWIPTDIPSLTHNFKIVVHYDASNTKLVQWLQNQGIDTSHAQGDIPVPLDDQAYQTAVTLWKAVKALTKDCKFYKVQDGGDEIYLASGADL